MASVLVDKNIDPDEECARCVCYQLMYSENKGKLKDPAFQPKPGERDASLLRLRYCDMSFCEEHGMGIFGEIGFAGVATIKASAIDEVNVWASSPESEKVYDSGIKEVNGMEAHINYAPMHDGKYVDTNIDVFTEKDVSLPMHADLKYREPLITDVKTRIRDYARQVLKRATFHPKEDKKNLG